MALDSELGEPPSTMTSAPPGWSLLGGFVLDANGTDIVASFFTTDAG